MDCLYLAHQDGDATVLADLLGPELERVRIECIVASGPEIGPCAKGDRRVVLPLYPQSSRQSGRLAGLVPWSTHLVWWSYLDAYLEAVSESIRGDGALVFCADDFEHSHDIYRRDVRDSAKKIATRLGRDHEVAFLGADLQERLAQREGPVMLVPLTWPIECAGTRALDELAAGRGIRTPVWGCHPGLVSALGSLVRRALSDDD